MDMLEALEKIIRNIRSTIVNEAIKTNSMFSMFLRKMSATQKTQNK